jgi:hypothetical protein
MFQHYQESGERFDYFLLSVCVALTGYLGASFDPTAIDSVPAFLEIFALVAFGAATMAGMVRAKHTVQFWSFQFNRLENGEKADMMRTAYLTSEKDIVLGGLLIPRHELLARADRLMTAAEQARGKSTAVQALLMKWYKIRNWAFGLGLGAYITGKIVASVLLTFGP